MTEVKKTSGMMRVLRLATLPFAIFFVGRMVANWLRADSADAWLVWLQSNWAFEFAIAVVAGLIFAVPTVYGLRTNRYIDRD
jgi:hypothetical protein